MVDTHAHIGLCRDGAAAVVGRAREAGVRRILTVGLDDASNDEAVGLAAEHEEVFASVGRHPNGASGFGERDAEALLEAARRDGVVAVGETGLDFYREGAPRADQLAAFRAQVGIAREVGKPLVIHMRSGEGPGRDAVAECFAVLAAEAGDVRVVLHCFSAGPERVAEAAERGWACSFAGNVTYPRAEALREAARLVPEDLLLAETDAPFLAPQSRRGRPNEPALVVETARELAAARGAEPPALEATIERNAKRLFGW